MAAPITHIVLAEEFLRRYPAAVASDFIIGTSFPDIRYLGVIAREETHDPDVDLQDILNEPDAFSAGMKHHVLADLVREKFIQDRDAYSSAPKSGYVTQAVKLYEDEMLYGRIHDRGSLATAFGRIIDQERKFSIAANDIGRWHDLLREYVSSAPSIDSRRKFIRGIGFAPKVVEEVERIIASLKNNEAVSTVIRDMYQDFTSLMRQ